MRGYLTKSLCETLHLEDGALGPQASFRDLGLDSVTGVEFVHGLNRAFGLHLDASIVYDHVHLDALSAYVTELVKKNREPIDGFACQGPSTRCRLLRAGQCRSR